jgi:nucleoid DNA-binding protein
LKRFELIKRIAEEADISERVAEKALDAALNAMEEDFQRGEIPTVIRKFVQTILQLTSNLRSGRSTREIGAPKIGVIKRLAVKPAAKKPAAKPVAKKPAAKKPAAKKPATKPVASKPATVVSRGPTGGGGPGKKR